MANINGWCRGTWGQGAWSTVLPVELSTVGAITSGLGSVSVVAKANVIPASQAVTAGLGAPSVVAGAVVSLTGQQAAASVGSPSVAAAAILH